MALPRRQRSVLCEQSSMSATQEDGPSLDHGVTGIIFYFHGKKDADFCLVSDPNLHINAHFIGKRNPNLTRDFTWVQSLGILFHRHKLFLAAQKTSIWNDDVDRLSLSLDGDSIPLPAGDYTTWRSQNSPHQIIVSRSGTANLVEVEVEGIFKIRARVVPIMEKESRIHNYGVTEEDCLAHLDLSFRFYPLSGDVEGVLGRTYGRNYVSKVKMGVAMPVVGGDREFAASSLFAADCTVARFGNGDDGSVLEEEFGDLNCATTGIDGRGVDLVGLLDDHTVGGVVFGAGEVSDANCIMKDEDGDEAIEDGNPDIVEGLLDLGATR
ncbi:hypothetical protein L484_004921 [Morus notabilis]|uniref:Uncharacterized protein n=1 Tax=Morus notabilis TaxID=981085 RepID=W9RM42_9ROSA|nr:uncharacterized protein LOC21388407 [Morus notabilis]EXB86423.1 hypothetical protein L484_004921 [Morus notabilis]